MLGDFGMSIWQSVPAMSLVLSRFPATVYLTLAVVVFSLTVALPTGVVDSAGPVGDGPAAPRGPHPDGGD
jgi:ABC-type dipeptide/oligopeptide/nickel transport system permease component